MYTIFCLSCLLSALVLNLQKHTPGRSTWGMWLLEIKTNTQCVHAGTAVSRQDGNLGNRERTGGRSLWSACWPDFTSLGAAGLYYYLGANIQPGVLGAGAKVATTEMKRKRGPGRPEERRENREAASQRQERSQRLEWQKQQREDIKNL